jgi:methyl-accepting chemotaxis protein
MKLMKLIKIRTKLFILIAVMILALLITGLIGIFSEMRMKQSLGNLYTQNVLAIEKLSDFRTQSRANYANILDLMIADNDDKQEILDDYKTRNTKIEEDENAFLKLDIDDFETKQYQLIQDNMAAWTVIANQMMDNISAGNIESAKKTFTDSGKESFESLQTSIRDLVDYNIQEAEDTYKLNEVNSKKAVTDLIVIMIVSIVIACALAIFITLSITGPIKKIVRLIDKTASLDLTFDASFLPLLTYRDEVGKISNAVQNLRNSLRGISGNVLSISTNLAANSEELAATTEESTRAINQVVVAINEIALGSSTQAEMVEKTSEVMRSMSSNIDEVNKTTIETSNIAKESISILEEGQIAIDVTIEKIKMNKKVTGDVGDAIQELSSQMDKVESIVHVISDISKQTNLLSLNASIEAARSGEAGKGFAVVASEIGGLASETAEAVKEITSIVQNTIEKNEKTARNNQIAKDLSVEQESAVATMKVAFDKIRISVNDITERSIKIAGQINIINDSSKIVADQTNDISATAQEGAASSEEISASNEEQLASIEMIASSASILSEMATELNVEISKFKL